MTLTMTLLVHAHNPTFCITCCETDTELHHDEPTHEQRTHAQRSHKQRTHEQRTHEQRAAREW